MCEQYAFGAFTLKEYSSVNFQQFRVRISSIANSVRQLQLAKNNMKKNMKTKMDVFECHFLADRPRSLAFQVSLVYGYFVFSRTKLRLGGFRRFSRFRLHANVL